MRLPLTTLAVAAVLAACTKSSDERPGSPSGPDPTSCVAADAVVATASDTGWRPYVRDRLAGREAEEKVVAVLSFEPPVTAEDSAFVTSGLGRVIYTYNDGARMNAIYSVADLRAVADGPAYARLHQVAIGLPTPRLGSCQ